MSSRFEDFLDATQRLTDSDAVHRLFCDAVAAEGYDNVLFIGTGRRRPMDVFCTKIPDGYAHAYISRNWEPLDPILRHSRTAKQAFVWDSVMARQKLTRKEVAFFGDCKDIGVHGGVTMPFHNPDGRTHVISVSLRDGPRPDPGRVPYLYALAAQTWVRHCALVGGDLDAPPQIQLTSRERECLIWAKDGKTNWEISQILSVAERTVEFHIGNVMRKLNATNRVTAIVIALQEGLITM